MTIEAAWSDERRKVVLVTSGESASVDELLDCHEYTRELLKGVEHRVDVLNDFRRLQRLPAGLLPGFAQLAGTGLYEQPNLGSVAVIVPPRFIKFWQAFSTVYHEIGVVSDMGAALAYLSRETDTKATVLF